MASPARSIPGCPNPFLLLEACPGAAKPLGILGCPAAPTAQRSALAGARGTWPADPSNMWGLPSRPVAWFIFTNDLSLSSPFKEAARCQVSTKSSHGTPSQPVLPSPRARAWPPGLLRARRPQPPAPPGFRLLALHLPAPQGPDVAVTLLYLPQRNPGQAGAAEGAPTGGRLGGGGRFRAPRSHGHRRRHGGQDNAGSGSSSGSSSGTLPRARRGAGASRGRVASFAPTVFTSHFAAARTGC